MGFRFLITVCLTFAAATVRADGPLSQLAMLRIEVLTVLETAGVDGLKMAGDGSISFSCDGNSYLLELSDDVSGLFYGRLSRSHPYTDEVTRERIGTFNRGYNYKIVKILCRDDGYSLRSEFLMENSKFFKRTYRRFIAFMDRTAGSLRSVCLSLAAEQPDPVFTVAEVAIRILTSDSLPQVQPVVTCPPETREGAYPLFVRLYRNNSLLQGAGSPADCTYADTLRTGHPSEAVALTPWPIDSLDGSYRCELWTDRACVAAVPFGAKLNDE